MMSGNLTGSRALTWILVALAVMSWGSVPTLTQAAEATASVGSVRSLAPGNWGSHRLGLGSVWALQTTPTTHTLRGVAYAANQYVAVGEGGTVLTSPDGTTWTLQTTPTTHTLRDVAYGAKQYVTVGEGGTVLTSPDGTK